MNDVFMSYSRKDDTVMRRIASFLNNNGIHVWLDHEKLTPGTPVWEEEIEKAIKAAAAVVVLMSPDSNNSEWVRREVSLADHHHKRIFPLLVRGDEETSIGLRLITFQYIDLRANETVGLKSFSAALEQYLETSNMPAQIPVTQATAGTTVQRGSREGKPFPKSVEAFQEPGTDQIAQSRAWTAIMWITLGWMVGGAIGGAAYWSSGLPGDLNATMGGMIGWAIGGLATAITLYAEHVLLNRKSIVWTVLAWAIGGAMGWTIGEAMTEVSGAAVGGAISAAIGVISTSRLLRIPSSWKRILSIIAGWTVAWAIGWLISRYIQIDLDSGAIGWPLGSAVGAAIGGFITGWQTMKRDQTA